MSLLIFDLDGVLVDTVEGHFAGWKAVASTVGLPFDLKRNDALRGVSRGVALDSVLDGKCMHLRDVEKSALLELKAATYREWVKSRSDSLVDPLVVDLLSDLQGAGFQLSVASASTNAKWILSLTGLERFFTYVSDGSSVVRTKPDPEQVERVLEHFGCSFKSAILFEDAQVGIQAGLAAGVTCVGIGFQPLLGVVRQFARLSEACVGDIREIANACRDDQGKLAI